jgi:TOBE domain-containing protein
VRLKLLLVTVFAAGLGASYALADDGHGKNGEGDHGHGNTCAQVHVRGTIAPQTLTVTLTDQARKLNLAPGSQVVLQLGAAGQTVSVNAEACSTTTGSSTQLLVRSAELKAKNPKTSSTTTTAPVTTTAPGTTTRP